MFLDELRFQRSHVGVHDWVHKAELQPISTVTADQLVVDKKLSPINGTDHWLYGAVNPTTNKIVQCRLFPATTKQTTRGFLAALHRQCQLDSVKFLVDGAGYLVNVLVKDGYRFQIVSRGNQNAIERVFSEIERQTYSFTVKFNHVKSNTAKSSLQILAARHNTRQT